jgi:hypothetical protein
LSLSQLTLLITLFSADAQKEARLSPGPFLFLLVTLGMSLFTVLASGLSLLLGGSRVLFALRVVAFAMMFGCSAMRFRCVFVMLGGFVVFVFSHHFLQEVAMANGQEPCWFQAAIRSRNRLSALMFNRRNRVRRFCSMPA